MNVYHPLSPLPTGPGAVVPPSCEVFYDLSLFDDRVSVTPLAGPDEEKFPPGFSPAPDLADPFPLGDEFFAYRQLETGGSSKQILSWDDDFSSLNAQGSGSWHDDWMSHPVGLPTPEDQPADIMASCRPFSLPSSSPSLLLSPPQSFPSSLSHQLIASSSLETDAEYALSSLLSSSPPPISSPPSPLFSQPEEPDNLSAPPSPFSALFCASPLNGCSPSPPLTPPPPHSDLPAPPLSLSALLSSPLPLDNPLFSPPLSSSSSTSSFQENAISFVDPPPASSFREASLDNADTSNNSRCNQPLPISDNVSFMEALLSSSPPYCSSPGVISLSSSASSSPASTPPPPLYSLTCDHIGVRSAANASPSPPLYSSGFSSPVSSAETEVCGSVSCLLYTSESSSPVPIQVASKVEEDKSLLAAAITSCGSPSPSCLKKRRHTDDQWHSSFSAGEHVAAATAAAAVGGDRDSDMLPKPKRRRKRSKNSTAGASKRDVKKEQNKSAANRYRQRKKNQNLVLDARKEDLEATNEQLKAQLQSLTRDINYFKKCLKEKNIELPSLSSHIS